MRPLSEPHSLPRWSAASAAAVVIPVGLGFGLINLFIDGRLTAIEAMGALAAFGALASFIAAALAELAQRRALGRRRSHRRGRTRRDGDHDDG